jgi:heme A synthase
MNKALHRFALFVTGATLLLIVAGAFLVTMLLGFAVITTLRRHTDQPSLTRPARITAALLIVQLCLGVAAYLTRQASPLGPQPRNPMVGITVAHVACGALVFALTIVLTLRSAHLEGVEAAKGYRRPSAQNS